MYALAELAEEVGFNTVTNSAIPGIIATTSLPITGTGAFNGDLAFDRGGNLYIVTSLGTAAAVGVVRGPLPSTGSGSALTDTLLNTYSNPNSYGYNGIAFDNFGHLFIHHPPPTLPDDIKRCAASQALGE